MSNLDGVDTILIEAYDQETGKLMGSVVVRNFYNKYDINGDDNINILDMLF